MQSVFPKGVLLPGLGLGLAVAAAGAMLPPEPHPQRSHARRPATADVALPVRKPMLEVQVTMALPDVPGIVVSTDEPELKPGMHGGTAPNAEPSPTASGKPALPERKPELRTADGVPVPRRKPQADPPGASGSEDQHSEAAAAPPASWSSAEIAAARSECEALLKGLAVRFAYAESVRQGACGAPQPIMLSGLGAAPEIVIDPPALMNCALAAKLATFMAESVQPLARRSLGAPIVRIGNATAYACRNRYNAAGQKLSEHARANAIDIAEFVTERGAEIAVAQSWGPVARDLLAAFKSKQKAQASAEAEPVATPEPVAVDATKALTAGMSQADTARDPELAQVDVPEPTSPEAIFLHGVHRAACSYFGTVLGPEANDAHRDHFHFDLAKRRSSAFCQ